MTDLERRALLGDRQAQEECTRLEIELPCPCCRGQAGVSFDISAPEETPYVCGCFDCDIAVYAKTAKEALEVWNRRPAPPIGRCKDCTYKQKAALNSKGFLICPASGMEITDDDFCSYFEEVPNG